MFRSPEFLWVAVLPAGLLARAFLGRVRGTAPSADPRSLSDGPGDAPALTGRSRGAAGNWRGKARLGVVSFRPAAGLAADVPPIPWRFALALLLVAGALARPQWGSENRPSLQSGSEILIALDLSRSMAAKDVSPSRFERARQIAADLIGRLPGERIGLIVFSGAALLQSPLSPDHDALLEFLPALRADAGPESGTDYGNLFRLAAESFGNEPGTARDLILISDGEANDPQWRQSLDMLASQGIAVIALGVGTGAGSTLPGPDGAVFRDAAGGVVWSRLESGNLGEIAARTGGAYVDATSAFDPARAARAILARDAAGRPGRGAGPVLKERFQWLLAPALLALAWSLWREFPVELRLARTRRRTPTAAAAPAPARTAAAVVPLGLALLCLAGTARADEDADVSDTLGEQLHSVVAQLAMRRPLHAADYAEMASMTVAYGRWRRAAHHPLTEGIVRDGLAAVEAGEALDGHAANWAGLHLSLVALLKPPPEPPPPPPPPPQAQSLSREPPPPSPEELALLQKLIRVREQDSAVRLYRLLHPPSATASAQGGKNW